LFFDVRKKFLKHLRRISKNLFKVKNTIKRAMEITMKRKTIIIAVCALVGLIGIVGTVMATGTGPAPNSGDCIPDGSGFETDTGSNGQGYGPGPAPNSGDGVPDGPGWE
jgi:hypothetical protein